MKLNVFYHPNYNIDLGLLNRLHPFDGLKFQKVASQIAGVNGVDLKTPEAPISDEDIALFVDSMQMLLLKKKNYILRALEVPRIPLLSFSWIDKKVLLPMRWSCSGTYHAAYSALTGENSWNIGGGFHHASKSASEGFCIYNDIGIAIQKLRSEGKLAVDDQILIVDIDAHHGNGNAYTFMDDDKVTLFDIYNDDIYPQNAYTKNRVDINVPLRSGTNGADYLTALNKALLSIEGEYRIAFVVAGTDVLATDNLGGFGLTIEESAERDALVARRLLELSIPFAFLGGGGYSSDSALAITKGIMRVAEIDG